MGSVLLALLVATSPAAARTYAVDPASSVVRYHVVHKLHSVTGSSSRVEGRAVLNADGTALAMVRVPIASFESGDRNRDAHMQEAVEAGRFPFVVFKGISRIDGSAQAATAEAMSVEARMSGEVELHGNRKPIEVPLRIELGADGTARARGTFEVSLESFGIERPSLLFVKIEDACRIEVEFSLREERS